MYITKMCLEYVVKEIVKILFMPGGLIYSSNCVVLLVGISLLI